MDRETLRTLVAATKTLPTLPLIRDRVARILENPQSAAKDVSAVIALDPIMTARLLQAVDWRRSIFGDRVPTVNKALSVLGFMAMRRLVESQTVIAETALGRSGAAGQVLQQLWLHAVATAIAARALAASIGYPEPEECYIAGLLHDLGKLVMHELEPDRLYGLVGEAERMHNTFYFCEVESGSPSHAVYGRILAEQWDLPPALVDAIGLHHTPNLAEANVKVVAVTHMADILARALGLGSGGDPFVPPPKPAGLSAVGLRATQVETVMVQIEHEYAKTAVQLR